MSNIEIHPDEPKYLATLVRGESHWLRNLSWENGRTLVIGETHMLHLEEHGVDTVSTSDGETMTKDRFEFEPYDGDHPIGYKFPTEAEVAVKEDAAKARERQRRIALAKLEPSAVRKAPEPAPAARARSRARG